MRRDQRSAAIGFRPLTYADLPAMLGWLSDPDVGRWYGEGEISLENLERKYGPRIDGTDPVDQYIIWIEGRDAGYIQAYVIDDEPDYARQIDVEPGAVGIDLFIGESAIRGRGWGVPVLRAFERIVFGTMRAPIAVIAPEPANERAIHVYAKAGFRWRKTVPILDEESPHNTGDEYVMTMKRADMVL